MCLASNLKSFLCLLTSAVISIKDTPIVTPASGLGFDIGIVYTNCTH